MITNITALAILASINPIAMPISAQADVLATNMVTINKQDILAEINVIKSENKKLAELTFNLVDTKLDIAQNKSIELVSMDSDESKEAVKLTPVKAEQSDEE